MQKTTSNPSFLLLLLGIVTRPARAKQPHLFVLVADDLGWADVSFHGGNISTPHLDKLSSRGTQLDQFYVQPVCSPTRAALMTGRYPIRYGMQCGVVRPWASHGLPADEQTIADGLKSAGYKDRRGREVAPGSYGSCLFTPSARLRYPLRTLQWSVGLFHPCS